RHPRQARTSALDRLGQPAQGRRSQRRADRRAGHRIGSAWSSEGMTKEIGRLLTAMVTPFTEEGAVDYDAAATLAQLLVADGSDGVVGSGTTGESPTPPQSEQIDLLPAAR